MVSMSSRVAVEYDAAAALTEPSGVTDAGEDRDVNQAVELPTIRGQVCGKPNNESNSLRTLACQAARLVTIAVFPPRWPGETYASAGTGLTGTGGGFD